MFTSRTQLVGLIGWPVEHSFSPAMQNAAIEAVGLDLIYLPFPVMPDGLPAALQGARALGIRGLNITLPHKESALRLTQPDAIGLKVGAVNTILFDRDRTRSTNTDVHGFEMLLVESEIPATGRVVVLGGGGAARAVVTALLQKARQVTLVTRRPREIAVAGATLQSVAWDAPNLARLFKGTELLIDATPRGLAEMEESLDLEPLPSNASVIDLTVSSETALTRAARARGLLAATGEAMLLHQGAKSFELWTGHPAPIDVMRQALARELSSSVAS